MPRGLTPSTARAVARVRVRTGVLAGTLTGVLAGGLLLAGCATAAPPPPPALAPEPPAPLVLSLEGFSGERKTRPLTFNNASCEGIITLAVTTETPWLRLPQPALVSDLAAGQKGQLPVTLDLTGVPPGEHDGVLEVSCVDCPPNCVYKTDVRVRMAVGAPPLPAVDLVLDLFHDLAALDVPRRLLGVHPAELPSALSREVPGFQETLRRLRTEAGVEPAIRVVPPAPGRLHELWPASWPVAEAPPMLLQADGAWVLVELHPVGGPVRARARPLPARPVPPRPDPPRPDPPRPDPAARERPQAGAPPPLLHYTVDPEHWPAAGRVRHILCADPETLRRVVVKLTYAGGADRREEAVEPARWGDCPLAASPRARFYLLEQPTREAAGGRTVIASGYFLDRRTAAGPVVAIPLPVD